MRAVVLTVERETVERVMRGERVYVDNSPEAQATRAASEQRERELAVLESLPKGCPVGCSRRFCEHRLERAEAALAEARARS